MKQFLLVETLSFKEVGHVGCEICCKSYVIHLRKQVISALEQNICLVRFIFMENVVLLNNVRQGIQLLKRRFENDRNYGDYFHSA